MSTKGQPPEEFLDDSSLILDASRHAPQEKPVVATIIVEAQENGSDLRHCSVPSKSEIEVSQIARMHGTNFVEAQVRSEVNSTNRQVNKQLHQ